MITTNTGRTIQDVRDGVFRELGRLDKLIEDELDEGVPTSVDALKFWQSEIEDILRKAGKR